MPVEIERKFLVAGDGWRAMATNPVRLRQGYLASSRAAIVRIRTTGDRDAVLTIKSAEPGRKRLEFEYAIPVEHAADLLALSAEGMVEKTRWHVPFGSLLWEVDVFAGDNEGLVLAEVEVPTAETEVEFPEWIGAEVTDDPRYYSSRLAQEPFRRWR